MSLYDRVIAEGIDKAYAERQRWADKMKKLAEKIGSVKGRGVKLDMMGSSYDVMFPSEEQAAEFIKKAGKKIDGKVDKYNKKRVVFWPPGKKAEMSGRPAAHERKHKKRYGQYSSPWS